MNDFAPIMQMALEEARVAIDHDDVPVGAVVVFEDNVIARRHNERELTGDPTAHAEILALRDAAKTIGSWRLLEATLVVTLEPCFMCAGATVASRIHKVVFAAHDPKAGAAGSLYNVCGDSQLNHQVAIESGLMASESSQLLKDFFRARR